ncbi:non-ribosomal peptide synthetase, partial [Pseudoalteromonas luteoviolacea]|uniref:non-ribosomal peptide synthetase n=1 Tax=Pseudoalteromonas luteoviolacea TaxID=43657 RepID=UPI00186BB08C
MVRQKRLLGVVFILFHQHNQTLQPYRESLLPNTTFVNEYGPTETVVGCSIYTVSPTYTPAPEQVAVPIGKPIQNTRLYVLSAGMQAQPFNSIGELYIGGDGVALGYVNRDDLTAERFITHPDNAAEPLYRTGDLVRWRDNGELEFIGRVDHQVKIRGYRIELGEIEEVLLRRADVRDAAVLALPNPATQQEHRLVAYVVPADYPQLDVPEAQNTALEALQNAYLSELKNTLPAYMVPSVCVLLTSMPLTFNGKVDRKALPAPEDSAMQEQVYVAPQNDTQTLLCDVWQQVLQVSQVGIKDNFFSIGGDSILSIRIVSLLKEHGITLGIQDLFTYQTVEALAAHVATLTEQVEHTEELAPFALLTAQEREDISAEYEDGYPMSALQAGMVFHTQMDGFSGVYHDINSEHIEYPWHQAHFEAALNACIARHPILRTGFRLQGKRPLQLVHKSMAAPLVVEDITEIPAAAQEQWLVEWREARKQHVFDWEQGPLFQINVFLRSATSFEFTISFHHAVLDGWSRATLTAELYANYEQLLAGNALLPQEADWTYRAYIAEELATLEKEDASQYFSQLLEDAPTEQLPLRRDGVNDGYHIAEVAEFDALAKPVVALAQKIGVPVQAVLLTAHLKALATMSGANQVMSCVTTNGRPERAGGEQGLGLFLNSLPLQLHLEKQDWGTLIKRVAELTAQSMPHRRYPLLKIQQNSEMEFNEVLFNYTHFHVLNQVDGGDLKALSSSGSEHTNFRLTTDISRSADGEEMGLRFSYDSGSYSASQIARLGEYYVNALHWMLNDITRPHQTSSLLSVSEQQGLLENHEPEQCFDTQPSLHSLFEARVAHTPDAIALTFEGQHWSYEQVNARANQLAHALVAQGVTANTLVGLCMERSAELIVGILAILKAGGAYVPLDPHYPTERLEYIIKDSELSLVVTEPAHVSHEALASLSTVMLSAVSGESTDNLSHAVHASDLAYVIYTSGSTGQPKGVLVEHGNVTRLFKATEAQFGFDEQDVWTMFHSPAFDFSVWEIWGALIYGGRLVVIPQWLSRSPEEFYQLLVAERVTILNQTPTAFTQLIREDQRQQGELALSNIIFGGEALNFVELKRWVQRHGDDSPKLINMYGITETTVHVTYKRVTQEDIAQNRGSLIGAPISDLSLYLLNGDGELVPQGTPGEMYVGGGGVTRGYLNRAELTSERFIDNPYKQGDKLYKTGDVARYLEDGELEYIGRTDDQVKIRGFRIELSEIEQNLSALEQVRVSTVIVREDKPGQKQLVAYAVLNEEAQGEEAQKLAQQQLRAQMESVLPAHMVPAIFVLMPVMPLTQNGKVDKRALPVPDAGQIQTQAYQAPETELETQLVSIWQSV